MLNNEDKKYLKDTVEKKLDNLDKKIDKGVNGAKGTSNPNSEIGKKLNDLYKQNQNREDREKLIEELQKKVNSGDATLAQKIELINQNLQKKIPDDVRDAWKMTAAEMKTGGKQAAKGIDSLITKIASVNPMLAMLYASSKDITKAAWDITAGTAKFGVGLAKGAAGILNSAVNMFKKKDEEKETAPEEETPKQEEQGRISIEGKTVEEYEDEEKSTAEKINEMHEWLFNKYPKILEQNNEEEKKKQSVLAKGLGGLGKSMQAVNKVIDVIAANHKLILGGLMLGALGVLAIVGWFKGGGPEKLLGKFKEGFATEGGRKAREKADNYVKGELAKIDKTAADYDNFMKTNDFQKGFDLSKTSYYVPSGDTRTPESLRATDMYDRLSKEGKTTELSNKNVQDMLWYGTVTAEEKRSNIKGAVDLKFPFEVGISSIKPEDDEHCGILVERAVKRTDRRYLYFTRALKDSVKGTKVFKKNEKVAVLDVDYRVYGDWDKFFDIKEGESFKDAEYRNQAPEIAKQANKIMEEAYHTSGKDDMIHRQQDKIAGTYKEYNGTNLREVETPKETTKSNVVTDNPNISTGANTENSTVDDIAGSPEVTQTQIPANTANQGNNTDEKVSNQQNVLKEQDKLQKQTEEILFGREESKKEPNIIALSNDNRTQGQAAETFDASQWNAATKA